MIITVNAKELTKALRVLKPILPPIYAAKKSQHKNTLPVLQNVLLVAHEDRITVAASNLTLYVEFTLSGDISRMGQTTVPLKDLLRLAEYTDKGTLSLGWDDGPCLVQTNTMSAELSYTDPNEFPAVQFTGKPIATLPVDSFRTMLTRTLFATSSSTYRGSLQNVYLVPDVTGITAIGTDAYRLSLSRADCRTDRNEEYKDHIGMLIPRKSAALLLRALPKTGDVVLSRNGNILTVATEHMRANVVLDGGMYVNYQHILPKDTHPCFSCNAGELARVLKYMPMEKDQFANHEKYVHIVGSAEGGHLTLTRGGATFTVPAEISTDLDFRYYPIYLVDYLAMVGNHAVSAASKNIVKDALEWTVDALPGWRYISMPATVPEYRL